MNDPSPDRRTFIDPFFVDLWSGLLRDRIIVWRDVRPALGGMVASCTCWRWRGAERYDNVVTLVRTGMSS